MPMTYTTATTEGVLLKYLQLRTQEVENCAVAISELVEDIRRLQANNVGVRVYSVNGNKDLIESKVVADLKCLRNLGLVRYPEPVESVRLSQWGRFYAELFELPPTVAEQVSTVVHDRRPLNSSPTVPL